MTKTEELAKQFGGQEVGKEPNISLVTKNVSQGTKNVSELAQKFGGQENNSVNTEGKGILRSVGDFFTGSTQAFGKNLGESIAAPQNTDKYNQAVESYSNITGSLLKAIKSKKAQGGDVTHLQNALQMHLQDAPKLEDFVGQDTFRRMNESFGQNLEEVAGQGLGTVLEATSGGLLETGAKGLASKELSLGQKVLQGSKIGATYGGIGGVSNAMQNEGSLGQVAGQALTGGALGAGLGVGAELVGSGIGKLSNSIDKSYLYNKIAPATESRIEKQAGFVKNAQENLAKVYKDTLPLTPLQQSREANLLAKKGDNVYTTLAKYNINVSDPKSVSHLQQISDLFENATQHAQINEHTYFNLDEIKARAFNDINKNISSETARLTAKNKIETELDSLIRANKNAIRNGQNGEVMINSDLVERLRRTGNNWTNFNLADPEKIGQSTGYALSNAVREQVDKQGTFPAYKEANREWGKVIHAQEVLNKIDASGKTFKTLGGLSGSIARRVLSGVLGYHSGGIGGALLSELGSEYSAKILSNPELRSYFDRKLIEKFGNTKATPKAISELEAQIKNYIDSLKGLKQLPEGGVNSAPIITPSPTTYEAPAKQVFNQSFVENAPTTQPINNANSNNAISKVSNKSSNLSNDLLTEAKKYKTAEEFVKFMRGSATQYGEYNPKLRATIGLFEDSARLGDLGIDPNKEVTIYRGIDGNIKNPKINDGDFVTTDYESAKSYTGGKVITMKVKANDLIADSAKEFDKNDPFYNGAEFVYSNSKNKLTNYTKSQLIDIWNKAHNKK